MEYTCVLMMTQEWHLRATAAVYVLYNSLGKTASLVEDPSSRCSIRELHTRVHSHSVTQIQTRAGRQTIEDNAAIVASRKSPFSPGHLKSKTGKDTRTSPRWATAPPQCLDVFDVLKQYLTFATRSKLTSRVSLCDAPAPRILRCASSTWPG